MNKPDFEQAFDQALETWRQRHHVRDDDTILLCLELFRIHQEHWDAIRRRDFPPFQEFRDTVLKLGETAAHIQRQTSAVLAELRRYRGGRQFILPTVAPIMLAVVLALITGLLAGKFLL